MYSPDAGRSCFSPSTNTSSLSSKNATKPWIAEHSAVGFWYHHNMFSKVSPEDSTML